MPGSPRYSDVIRRNITSRDGEGLSGLQGLYRRKTADDVVAVLASDLHLSHTAPLFRSAEPSWYAVMERYLHQLRSLASTHSATVIVAGDVFHRWNPPPELVNFAIRNLPHCYAIPGQHDLPHHNYESKHRSAYQTLVEAGVITDLEITGPARTDDLVIHGYPFGFEVESCPQGQPLDGLNVAVIHSFIWTKSTGYIGAPKSNRLDKWLDRLKGYDVAVYGDNHRGFHSIKPGIQILNCGGFIRRNRDEMECQPSVGLLYKSGRIERHYLDTSEDVFLDQTYQGSLSETDYTPFIEGLLDLEDKAADFVDLLLRALEQPGVRQEIKQVILDLIEEAHGRVRS